MSNIRPSVEILEDLLLFAIISMLTEMVSENTE